ncbi:hypothetical protein D3C81_588380 [compost metagenome]
MADFRRPRRAATRRDVVDHFHGRGGQCRAHTGLAGDACRHLVHAAPHGLYRTDHRRPHPQRAQPRHLLGVVAHPARPHGFFNLQQVQAQGFHTAPRRCLRRRGRVRGQLLRLRAAQGIDRRGNGDRYRQAHHQHDQDGGDATLLSWRRKATSVHACTLLFHQVETARLGRQAWNRWLLPSVCCMTTCCPGNAIGEVLKSCCMKGRHWRSAFSANT